MPFNRLVHAYHAGPRTPPPVDRLALGIELELEGVASRAAVVGSFPEHRAGDHPPPAFERDASLGFAGVEVIFPPISVEQIKDPESYINRAVKALREAGTTRKENGAGMHINVNLLHLNDPLAGLRMAIVVHSMPRAALCRIGGRPLNQYCAQRLRGVPDDKGIAYSRGYMAGHYSAANPMPDRLELRYPVSSLDPEHWEVNIRFTEVLLRFAESTHAARTQLVSEVLPAFTQWMHEQEDDDAISIKKIIWPRTA